MRWIHAYFTIYWISTTALSKEIKLNTTPNMNVRCKERIVLHCTIVSPEPVQVIKMEWDHLCNHSTRKPYCEFKLNKTLKYTFPNATPEHGQVYTCIVEAKQGHGTASTNVTVQGCTGGQDGQFNISSKLWIPMFLSLVLSYGFKSI